MKKSLFVLSIALLGTLLSSNVIGQNFATTALTLGMPQLNLLSSISGPISLQLTTTIAGEAVEASKSDSTARLRISSVIAEAKPRTLSAKVSAGVPAGTLLKLEAKNPTGATFGGTKGVYSGIVTLSESDANIITGIGSCYSGTATDDGYKLKYTWALIGGLGSYADVRATAGASVTVTLTLSAPL